MKSILIYISLFILKFVFCFRQDPFAMLGIPALDPNNFAADIGGSREMTLKPEKKPVAHYAPDLRSIGDLPVFLEKAKLSEEEGIQILSKFLIADDYFLKKYGAVYDQTGFDGLSDHEPTYSEGNPMRLVQRAKSAASLWYKRNFQSGYEAYGAEIVPNQGNNNWKVFKVLLVGRNCGADHLFLKVCIPVAEDLVPLVVNESEDCMSKIMFVENAKAKNIPYLKKIRHSHFFPASKKPHLKQSAPPTNTIPKNPAIVLNRNIPSNTLPYSPYINNNAMISNPPSMVAVQPPALQNLNIHQHKLNVINSILSGPEGYQNIKTKLLPTNYTITSNSSENNNYNKPAENLAGPIFIQNKEKILNKRPTGALENSIDDRIIDSIFESSKKKLLQLLKQKKGVGSSITVSEISSENGSKKMKQLEQQISNLNSTVSRLEKRLDTDEKNSSKTAEELGQIKQLLEGNFKRLDNILVTLTKNNIK